MTSPTPSSGINTLVHGTSMEGTLNADNDIRIDGELKGHLNCKGKVIVGPTGHVDGEIRCANAVIEGSFNGKLVVEEVLNVRDSAKIEGDIKTDKLVVQSGAVFNVSCTMGGQKLKGMTATKDKANLKEDSLTLN